MSRRMAYMTAKSLQLVEQAPQEVFQSLKLEANPQLGWNKAYVPPLRTRFSRW